MLDSEWEEALAMENDDECERSLEGGLITLN
jgi:hypothetical protein